MNIIRIDDANFEEFWQLFIKENINVGVFYSLTILNQELEYGKKNEAENKSFIICIDNSPVAIVPLLLEKSDGLRFFWPNLGVSPLFCPVVSCLLGQKIRRKIRNFAFEEIHSLANQFEVAKVMLSIHPSEYFYEKEYFNYLTKYGFIDASIGTQIIDLTEKLDTLKAGRRKHCKALVNKGLREYTFFVMDKDCADYEIHERYRLMHAKAAGRVTRTKKTFDLQYESLTKGEATLIGTQYRGKDVQIIYFDHLNQYVNYSSSADDPDFNSCDVPTAHSLLWYAIEYFKDKGFKYFELGSQFYGHQLFNHPSEKEINISFFKRSFGGMTVPFFMGVKYYNEDYMKADMENHFQKLVKSRQV
ncbi:MAG: hypothetical protein KKC46_02385 [Proteobacteria bacterium]|nr:hypothetical protein [Pseudomonadota bacterium]